MERQMSIKVECPGEESKVHLPASGQPLPTTAVAITKRRYEEIWSEDVHAAFMEAVSIYPPMGKKRIKYRRVLENSTNNLEPDPSHIKSFGRCQLIQSYILERTGKVRTRKQVSSHLQRFKKIHKNNPSSLFCCAALLLTLAN
ncbi:TEA-domain-containing protein [Leucogyrophana mollusca]|uniref:TEA-domain-containing protein n=1 Tax=Leucogyrophana mollusca TaxID=85980 RepID=A0ACB8BZA2_9AGAM|nr:TEA-domain-containing protein [Leucogyrophana mollusca]